MISLEQAFEEVVASVRRERTRSCPWAPHKTRQPPPQQAVGVQASLTSELEVWIDDAYFCFTSIDRAQLDSLLARCGQSSAGASPEGAAGAPALQPGFGP
jgi:hypothetical protein